MAAPAGRRGAAKSGQGGVMWELTGNHVLALPAIDLDDGSIHAANVLLRGPGALLSWTSAREPVRGADALIRVELIVNGVRESLQSPRWERLDRWVPRLRATTPSGLGVSITICAPGGYDPLVPGAVVHVELENASGAPRNVTVAFAGCWLWSLTTVVTTRPTTAMHRLVSDGTGRGVVLEVDGPAAHAALALTGGAGARASGAAGTSGLDTLRPDTELAAPNGTALRYRIESDVGIAAGRRGTASLWLGVAPERDGALAVTEWLRHVGGPELIRLGRLDLARIGRSAEGPLREVVSRNLAFHHYCSVARAVDDERLYPVLSRSPVHGACAVFSEQAALSWSLPAHALVDPGLARELYFRILEQYSDRPGRSWRYLDGGALTRGFSLGNVCAYVLALERHVDTTGDTSLLDDPLVRQVLRELDELVYSRLHPEIFIAGTEVMASGDRTDYPYVSFDNVLLWRFCRAIDRFGSPAQGEPRFRMAEGDEEAAAAFWQRCTTDVDGLHVIVGSTDTSGAAAVYDDPAGSLRLLPFLGFCDEDDPIWTNTMDFLHSKRYPLWHGSAAHPGLAGRARPRAASMAALCADLLGPRRAAALDTLRGLDLPGGVACETWDPDTGHAADGPWAAAEAGFLVWALLWEPRPGSGSGTTR